MWETPVLLKKSLHYFKMFQIHTYFDTALNISSALSQNMHHITLFEKKKTLVGIIKLLDMCTSIS